MHGVWSCVDKNTDWEAVCVKQHSVPWVESENMWGMNMHSGFKREQCQKWREGKKIRLKKKKKSCFYQYTKSVRIEKQSVGHKIRSCPQTMHTLPCRRLLSHRLSLKQTHTHGEFQQITNETEQQCSARNTFPILDYKDTVCINT